MDPHLLATLLKRARQTPLDITLHYSGFPIHYLIPPYPFAQQIRSLDVNDASRDDILNLSAAISGPLPLLRNLSIEDDEYSDDSHFPFAPTFPLFQGAVNVKEFLLYTFNPSSLSQFAFPNLTTFDLLVRDAWEGFSASLLLNFLEASPSLQDISIVITGNISYNGVFRDRVLVLPCVKDFCLDTATERSSWGLATHLSCPSVERAEFWLRTTIYGYDVPEDIYPPPPQWNAIVRQYPMAMVDEVELRLAMDEELTCTINFWSSKGATLDLHYTHFIGGGPDRATILDEKIGSDVFSQASKTIRDYPQLEDIRRLSIVGGGLLAGHLELTANDVGKLLGSVGPLEGLDLEGCDLRPYLDPFLETPLFPDAIQPISFPPIKEFTIFDPIQSLCDNEAYAAAVVGLAKSQHARGVPFERVFLPPIVPSWVVEGLSLSVNKVERGPMLPEGGGGQT